MDATQAYGVLGLEPGVPRSLLRRQYRRLAKRWHPDRFQDAATQVVAARMMQEINETYSFLQGELRTGMAAQASNTPTRRTKQQEILWRYAARGEAFDFVWNGICAVWILLNLAAMAVAVVMLAVAVVLREPGIMKSHAEAIILIACLGGGLLWEYVRARRSD